MTRIATWRPLPWPKNLSGEELPFLMGIIKLTREPGEWTLINNCWNFCHGEEKIFTYCPHAEMIFITGTLEDRIVFMREFLRQVELSFFIRGRGFLAVEIGHSVLDEYLPVFSVKKDPS